MEICIKSEFTPTNKLKSTGIKRKKSIKTENEGTGKIKRCKITPKQSKGAGRSKKKVIIKQESDIKIENFNELSFCNGQDIKDEIKQDPSLKKEDVKPSTSNVKKIKVTKTKKTVKSKQEDSDGLKDVDVKRSVDGHVDEREVFLLQELASLTYKTAYNIIQLINEEATIPFMVRYRKHLIGDLTSDNLRSIRNTYETVKKILSKAEKMKAKLKTDGHLTEDLEQAINCARSLDDLEYLNEPFKVRKTSKLMKVIDLGLVFAGESLLFGRGILNLSTLINHSVEELKNESAIKELLTFYIGNAVSKDVQLLKMVGNWKTSRFITINCEKKSEPENKDERRRCENFSNYYKFSKFVSHVQPHQILAINRGETKNFLKVSVNLSDELKGKLFKFIEDRWYRRGLKYPLRTEICNNAFTYIYSKRVVPFLKRAVRSDLTKRAEQAAVDVFSKNLKYLLLTPPTRGLTLLAIDPGFSHGCKVAVLSPQQEILMTSIVYLQNSSHFEGPDSELVRLINQYHVDLIAIGNGVGCREVESKVTTIIENRYFNHEIYYIIINENGVSSYSCTKEASLEYPDISPNIISAISLAKRVQDPLCEYVKVDPKHLGVGMYQHDINEKKLETTLEEVVMDCVSSVGVDINVAPLIILKRIAGLTEKKAKVLIEKREKDGPFFNRSQLNDIKGIGPKTFQQCSGFIKILPETLPKNGNKKLKINPLDQTIIHPEDYKIVQKIATQAGVNLNDIGTIDFINKVNSFFTCKDKQQLADSLSIPPETMKVIIEGLTRPSDYDVRSSFDKPLFRKGLRSMKDISVNDMVTGQVQNVTPFGAFVDIGIEHNGLIPSGFGSDLHTGQRVQVEIFKIDRDQKKITLSLIRVIPVGEN